jgi:hypothetical protein
MRPPLPPVQAADGEGERLAIDHSLDQRCCVRCRATADELGECSKASILSRSGAGTSDVG